MSVPFFPGLLLPHAIRPLGYGFFIFLNRHGAPIWSAGSLDLDAQDAWRICGLDEAHALRLGLTITEDRYLFYTDANAPWLGRDQWRRYALILEAVCTIEPCSDLPPMPEWAETALARICAPRPDDGRTRDPALATKVPPPGPAKPRPAVSWRQRQ